MQNIKISPTFAMATLLIIFASLGTVLWMSSHLESRPSPKALEGAPPQKEEKKDAEVKDLNKADDQGVIATGKNPAYLKNVYEKDGQRFIEADYIQWFTGKEALKAMIEDGQCMADVKDKAGMLKEVDLCYPNCADKFGECVPAGYHIRNVNPKLRTLELSPEAKITKTMVFEGGGDEPKEITFSELKNNFNNDITHFQDLPFWITSENNLVKKLDQQYLP